MASETLQYIYFCQKCLKTVLFPVVIAFDSNWCAHVAAFKDLSVGAFSDAFTHSKVVLPDLTRI